MAYISIENLTVEFKIYGMNSRSLKKRVLSQVTGGIIAAGADDAVTVKALDNISLEIKDGDRIGLIGHNGAGKTTLLRALSGLHKPTGGKIEIKGAIGTLIDPSAGMDMEATGIENIYLRSYILGMTKQQIDSTIEDISDFTELGNFLHLPTKTYSAGMFSRLSFAISTSISPDILLVDEGIGAGDAAFLEKANKRIKNLHNGAKILLLASHSIENIKTYCTKAIEFKRGKIVRQVNVSEL